MMETKTDHWKLALLTDKIRTVIITLIVTGSGWERAQKLTMSEVMTYSEWIAKLFVQYGYDDNVVNRKTIHKNSPLCRELYKQMSQAFTSGVVEYDILQVKEGEERLGYFQPVVTKGGES
jgi:hypothetical protein